jgi:hypothetical protein
MAFESIIWPYSIHKNFNIQPVPKHFPVSRDTLLEHLLCHAIAGIFGAEIKGERGKGKERLLGELPFLGPSLSR